MQNAVRNLGTTYTDDQINQLAQLHFENSQVHLCFVLTLKRPNKNCSRRHFNFLLLSFKEN